MSLDAIISSSPDVHPVIVVETGADQNSWVNVNPGTQTAPAPLDATLLSPERISSTVSFHSTSIQGPANHSSGRVEDVPHLTRARNAVSVEEQGAGRNYWINWLIGIQMALTSLDAMTLTTLDATPPPLGRVSSTVSVCGH
ncbi:hypothetical protein BDR05DRAFT_630212 [Suillus weaverae]|nr:hypothetical protein BDR05DRAFT_630212 [Suillus weaverae]